MWDYLVKAIRPLRTPPESSDIHATREPDASARIAATDNETASGGGAAAAHRRAADRRLKCPACGAIMRTESLKSVEIDRCPGCGGVFLDRGELQAIFGRDFSSYAPGADEHERPYVIYTPHGLSDHVRDPE
jgi:Zn-finger nucleic acid-binding protein